MVTHINKSGLPSNRINREQRASLQREIERHRKLHFSILEYDERGETYVKRRDLDFLKVHHKFDLLARMHAELTKKRKLFVLDSGAGYLRMSGGVKRAFGGKVFITALSPINPKAPNKVLRELRAKIRALRAQPVTFNRAATIRDLETHLSDLTEAEKISKAVDEMRITPIETFTTTRHYDLILDFSGPVHHSLFHEIAIGKYFKLLNPNGTALITLGGKIALPQIKEIINTHYGPEGIIAKTSGYCLTLSESPEGVGIFEVRKTPVRANKIQANRI